MLTGCDTALPVEGDRMSSPPPISVMSCTGLQGLHPALSEQATTRRSYIFTEKAIPCRLNAYESTDHRKAATHLLGAPAVRLVGAPGCRSPGWLRSAGVRVPETTRSGSLYPHLARTWSASECTSATSCSACAQTRTQARHSN